MERGLLVLSERMQVKWLGRAELRLQYEMIKGLVVQIQMKEQN